MTASAASSSTRNIALVSGLVLATMIPATIVIPVLRPFVATSYPHHEWLVHAFMTVNLLGACCLGPLLAVQANRRARRRLFAGLLALLDGAMLLGVALEPPWPVMLALRFVQGAASVGAVSILMGAGRGHARTSAAMGVVGGSVVLAIVIAIPLGAILGRESSTLPLFVGGAIGVVAGLGALLMLPQSTDLESSSVSYVSLLTQHTSLRPPTLVVGLERMAVGAFVVTLQLYGHHVLEVADRQVSGWFTSFLVTFAFATWPMTRLGERIDRWKVVALGAFIYGLMFVLLGLVPKSVITPLLIVGGLGSAAIYGPALTLATQSVPSAARGSAMAMLNAAGTLGMFVGNLGAFALVSILSEWGFTRSSAFLAVFITTGVTQVVSIFVALHRTSRSAPAPSPL